MLLSMTGFGEARSATTDLSVGIEVRSVNNRFLKVSVRGSDPWPMLESDLEKVVRRVVRRGTLHIQVRCSRPTEVSEYSLNAGVLMGYIRQLRQVCDLENCPELVPTLVPSLLTLPGVAPENASSARPPDEESRLVEHTLELALAELQKMRKIEGREMAVDLMRNHATIVGQLSEIRERMPVSVENYRKRVHERVSQILAAQGVSIAPSDLIREVALFAERSDISEEVARLDSHLRQFVTIAETETDAPGRKLEFLTQEMGREANTIGSKSGDAAISRCGVEIKAALEKIREMIQNIE